MAESSRDRLLKQFRELVVERLGRINQHLMGLEAGANPDLGKAALRELHGLKGEARMMGFQDINALVHEMEGVVRAAESRGFALTGGSTDALLVAADAVMTLSGAAAGAAPPDLPRLLEWLKARIGAEASGQEPPSTLGAPGTPSRPAPVPTVAHATPTAAAVAPVPAPAPAAAKRTGEAKSDGSIRIGAASLEVLTGSVNNLAQIARRRELANRTRLGLIRDLSHLSRAAEQLGSVGADLAARLGRAKDAASELHRQEKLLANEELRDLGQMSDEVHSLRMLPLALLFEAYPRMVRDLARELGKEVDLAVHGEATRADRSVVDGLREPLLHLVRNALDHGLEFPKERSAAGKPAKGKLSLRASREGERILLVVEDDGRGLDPVGLRKTAVRKGLISEADAALLSDAAAMDLIFLSGFSSKDEVTDLSGRGVGLDVVRTVVRGLGGDVVLRSISKQGAAFELRVPVSLTVSPLLFVEVGDDRLCLSAANVARALRVDASAIRELAGRPALRVDDEILPFASIHSILGAAPERAPAEGELVLLVKSLGATAAISVDRVLEERVQPILPLRGMLSRLPHLSGATPLADGRLAMVLSAAHLLSSARGSASYRLTEEPRRANIKKRKIMVVDDSPLTRELISSLLDSVGYQIVNANDGQEAFDRLVREAVDMVVTDLEMPRMDGLELTRRLKAHATLRSLPVVIVTTRGSDADRRRGMDAGADGYISKGDLVRQDLVDVVARLLN